MSELTMEQTVVCKLGQFTHRATLCLLPSGCCVSPKDSIRKGECELDLNRVRRQNISTYRTGWSSWWWLVSWASHPRPSNTCLPPCPLWFRPLTISRPAQEAVMRQSRSLYVWVTHIDFEPFPSQENKILHLSETYNFSDLAYFSWNLQKYINMICTLSTILRETAMSCWRFQMGLERKSLYYLGISKF